jgi:hypothetical protein
MLDREYGQGYPSKQKIANLSAELTITCEDLRDEGVEALLEVMRYVFANGGAWFASFILGPSVVLDYFAPRDQLDEFQFWSRMLQAPQVVEALPWLGDIYLDQKEIRFQRLSAYYLDGDLAETLMRGGAYRHFSGTAEEAKQIGIDFCSAVFENRYDEMMVRKTKDAWANWFMNTPWDNTWLGLDRRARRFWILCSTDTD